MINLFAKLSYHYSKFVREMIVLSIVSGVSIFLSGSFTAWMIFNNSLVTRYCEITRVTTDPIAAFEKLWER